MLPKGTLCRVRGHNVSLDVTTTEYPMHPVAVVRSPFAEKFGIPRQAGLAPDAIAEIQLLSPYDDPAMLQDLVGFSHLWLTFVFDRCLERGWQPKVRPPRLGGNREVGVWASRSPFRPNGLGLSLVRLLEVVEGPAPLLRVGGVDLLDGTPVLDIKPYLPYSDCIADAEGGYAAARPDPALDVVFTETAEGQLASCEQPAQLRRLITQVLALDPRPAYRRGAEPDRVYGMRLAGLDVRWVCEQDRVRVLELAEVA